MDLAIVLSFMFVCFVLGAMYIASACFLIKQLFADYTVESYPGVRITIASLYTVISTVIVLIAMLA